MRHAGVRRTHKRGERVVQPCEASSAGTWGALSGRPGEQAQIRFEFVDFAVASRVTLSQVQMVHGNSSSHGPEEPEHE